MKKFFLIWAVLALAVPAMAVVNVTATQVGDTNEVDITVLWSGEATPPRAFALDITVTAGTITKVANYHTGESRGSGDRGFGIFPASFAREIDADDPCWADVNYTPVADVNDLVGGTLGGIGTGGITIEMGSLYTGPNVPPSGSRLCTIWVTDDCNMCFDLNVGRAGIVLEDGNAPGSDNMPFCAPVILVVVCTVPNVVDDTNDLAQARIIAAGFTIGNITTECSDTIADGNVISTNPAAFATPECGTAVDIVVSGHPDHTQWVLVGKPDCWCDPWQCRGDADGTGQGIGGKYRVSTYDNEVYRAAYNKSVADFPGGKTWADTTVFDVDPGCTPAVASVLLICADIDHLGQGIGGKLRVSTNDTPFFRSGALGGNNNVPDLPTCP